MKTMLFDVFLCMFWVVFSTIKKIDFSFCSKRGGVLQQVRGGRIKGGSTWFATLRIQPKSNMVKGPTWSATPGEWKEVDPGTKNFFFWCFHISFGYNFSRKNWNFFWRAVFKIRFFYRGPIYVIFKLKNRPKFWSIKKFTPIFTFPDSNL